jgi:hypothetical protein
MKALLLLLSFTCAGSLIAQVDTTRYKFRDDSITYTRPTFYTTKSIAVIGGYYYYKRNAIELGIGKKSDATVGHHPFTGVMYVSTEITRYQGDLLWGPKIGVMGMGGCCGGSMGLSLIYYTHPEGSSLKFRPEIGFGISVFRAFYGRSFSITNKEFWPFSPNVLGVNVVINVMRLSHEITGSPR